MIPMGVCMPSIVLASDVETVVLWGSDISCWMFGKQVRFLRCPATVCTTRSHLGIRVRPQARATGNRPGKVRGELKGPCRVRVRRPVHHLTPRRGYGPGHDPQHLKLGSAP